MGVHMLGASPDPGDMNPTDLTGLTAVERAELDRVLNERGYRVPLTRNQVNDRFAGTLPEAVASAPVSPADLARIARFVAGLFEGFGDGDDFRGRRLLNLFRTFFCNFPDRVQGIEEARCIWNIRTIKITRIPYQGLTRDEQQFCTEQVCAAWSSRFDLNFEIVEPGQIANIDAQAARMGGRGGILADSMLVPCGATEATVLRQRYDVAEDWRQNEFRFAIAVGRHEVGHALGFPHIPGFGNALMNASISNLWDLTERDIQQTLAFGYRRRATPPPPVIPTNPPVTPTDPTTPPTTPGPRGRLVTSWPGANGRMLELWEVP